MSKATSYSRAWNSILYYLLSFSHSRKYIRRDAPFPRDGASTVGWYPEKLWLYPGETAADWNNGHARVGDLILLSSIREHQSDWLVCWLLEVDDTHLAAGHGRRYLCKSAKTGEECWWGDVGVSYYDREVSSSQSHWHWTDEQWAANDKWMRTREKLNEDTYIPTYADFDGDKMIVGLRAKWALSELRPTREIPLWRKATVAQMVSAYREMRREFKDERDRKAN